MNAPQKQNLYFSLVQLVAASILLLISVLSVQASPKASVTLVPPPASETSSNEDSLSGSNHFLLAIREYERALKLDHNYAPALQRLAETYVRYGNSLQAFPNEALRQFHRAYYFNNASSSVEDLIDACVQRLGLKPNSFEDRRFLGEAAFDRGDFIDSVVELRMALSIQDDFDVNKKLLEAQDKLNGTLYGEKLKDIPAGTQNTLTKVDKIAFGPYMRALQMQIKAQWKPPRQSISASSVVRFKVEQNGTLRGLKLVGSSGTSTMDIAALRAVSDAAPFPSLPNGSHKNVDIQFKFDYNIFGSPTGSETESLTRAAFHYAISRGSCVIPSLAR